MLKWTLKCLLLSLCLSLAQHSVAQRIALSFDDGLDPQSNPEAAQINAKILHQLQQAQIPAIVYPSVSKIGGKEGLALIAQWGEQGQQIGNHGDLHLNLHQDQLMLSDYLTDMDQGHQTFSPLKGFVPRYRFPYLKEGNTLEKRDAVRTWLKQHQYQSGAVSIDASDWYYNILFLQYQKNKDTESLVKLKQAYIAHLLDRAAYYDQLAMQNPSMYYCCMYVRLMRLG